MKFDPFVWSEIDPNKDYEGPAGRLRLVLSSPAAVFITADGFEVCAGYGVQFDLKLSVAYSFRVDGKGKDAPRVFQWQPPVPDYASTGTIFTNADRMPWQSGNLSAVQKALRLQQLQQAEWRAQMRRDMAALKSLRDAATPPAAAPAPAPASEASADGV